jgi:peptidyl-prolyl cis-trans isomerase D
MLQNIREKTQSWFAVLIIGFIVVTFALWGIHNYVTGKDHREAAVVNGEVISVDEVNTHFERLRQQQQAAQTEDGQLPVSVEMRLKQQALDETISQHVLNDAADKQGYYISDQQLQMTLSTIPAFQVEGTFNQSRFEQVLGDIHYTPQGFIKDIQKALKLEQVRRGFVDSAFVVPVDAQQAVRLINQTRDIDYFSLPVDRFKNKVTVTDAEVKNFYQQNPQQYTKPAQVTIQYVELSLADVLKGTKVSDTDMKQYYQENLASFTSPARWHLAHILVKVPTDASSSKLMKAEQKADSLYKEINEGRDFAQLAKDRSDDVISARMGGEMGWFHAANLDPTLLNAVKLVKKSGTILPPIRTTYGYSIIKVMNFEPEKIEPFPTVSSQIAQTLQSQRAEQRFFDLRDQLANLAFSNPDSLKVASDALELPMQTSDWFTKKGTQAGIATNPQVVSAAFSDDVYKQNNNSQVVEINPEQILVLRILKRQEPTLIPFNQVSNEIRAQLISLAAKSEAKKVGETALQQLRTGANLQTIAARNNVGVSHADKLKRTGSKLPQPFVEHVFKLPRPIGQMASVGGFTLPNGDYMIVRIKLVEDGNYDQTNNEQQHYIRHQLEEGLGQLDYAFYVQSSIKSADIEIKNDELKVHPSLQG